MRLAKGCASWLVIPSILFVLGWFIALGVRNPLTSLIAIVCTILLLGFVIFFRDPELPIGEGVVSPANGKVTGVESTGKMVVIKVFMNVWNIHVNRSPMEGTVLSVEHIPGGHIPAFDKDAESNERVVTELATTIGILRIVQIAGSVARRIVPYISQGQVLQSGERIGIIRLGSRVDLHLPKDNVKVVLNVGDKVRPGQQLATISIPGAKEREAWRNRESGNYNEEEGEEEGGEEGGEEEEEKEREVVKGKNIKGAKSEVGLE